MQEDVCGLAEALGDGVLEVEEAPPVTTANELDEGDDEEEDEGELDDDAEGEIDRTGDKEPLNRLLSL